MLVNWQSVGLLGGYEVHGRGPAKSRSTQKLGGQWRHNFKNPRGDNSFS